MQEDFEEAAGILKNQVPSRKLAKIDGEKNEKIADKYNIRGYPTLYFFK